MLRNRPALWTAENGRAAEPPLPRTGGRRLSPWLPLAGLVAVDLLDVGRRKPDG